MTIYLVELKAGKYWDFVEAFMSLIKAREYIESVSNTYIDYRIRPYVVT